MNPKTVFGYMHGLATSKSWGFLLGGDDSARVFVLAYPSCRICTVTFLECGDDTARVQFLVTRNSETRRHVMTLVTEEDVMTQVRRFMA